MQCRPQLEALAGYLTDFVSSLPASTRGAVSNHVQLCLQAVAQEFQNLEYQLKDRNTEGDKQPGDPQLGPAPTAEVSPIRKKK